MGPFILYGVVGIFALPSRKYLLDYLDKVLVFTPVYGLYYTLKRFTHECFPTVTFTLEVVSLTKTNTGFIDSSARGIGCLVTSGVMALSGIIFAELYLNYKKRAKEFHRIKKARPVVDKRLKQELASGEPIIMEFNDVCKTYSDGAEVLKEVTFNIPKGNIFGILGPNGAGKSTLFNIATLQLRRTEGEISIEGRSIYKGFKDSNTITLCPQSNRYWEFLTAREHLEFIALLKGLSPSNAKTQVNELISILGMESEADKYPDKLSGGNLRKLSASLGIIGYPSCAFFDEPSVGLDPESRRRLWNAFDQLLKSSGGSVVISTHRMDEAETACNNLGILICGQLFAYGSPASLKKAYGKGYTIYVTYRNSVKLKECKSSNNSLVLSYLKDNYGLHMQEEKNEGAKYKEINVHYI